MSKKLTFSTLFFSLFLLTACGGGGGGSNNDSDPVPDPIPATDPSTDPSTDPDPSNVIPQAVITAASQIDEGTTSIDIDASESSDDGSIINVLWAIEDNGGIENLQIADSAGISTQVINIPDTLGEDVTITISLIVTDNDDNDSAQVTQSITLVNGSLIIVNTGSFDGTWDSPCFDTTNNTSIEQTLTINDTSLTSNMLVYSAGPTPAFGCVLPPSSTGLIIADAITTLSFGSQSAQAGCVDGQAVNTSIAISSITVGEETSTSEADINGVLALIAPSVDVLPPSTDICLLTNGNLLYAGAEYTRSTSP